MKTKPTYHLIENKVVETDTITAEQEQEEARVKTLLFFQYPGQDFEYHDEIRSIGAVNLHGAVFDDEAEEDGAIGIEDCTLSLREVSGLTDVECIEIAKLQSNILKECAWDSIKVTRNLREYIQVWAFKDTDHMHLSINEYSFYSKATDYARSIGCLLDFTYLSKENKPITLPANDIKRLGWAQIQK